MNEPSGCQALPLPPQRSTSCSVHGVARSSSGPHPLLLTARRHRGSRHGRSSPRRWPCISSSALRRRASKEPGAQPCTHPVGRVHHCYISAQASLSPCWPMCSPRTTAAPVSPARIRWYQGSSWICVCGSRSRLEQHLPSRWVLSPPPSPSNFASQPLVSHWMNLEPTEDGFYAPHPAPRS